MLALTLLACTKTPPPPAPPPPAPVVQTDVQGLRKLAPLPEKVEEVVWVYAPMGTPGGLGPTDYALRAWVTPSEATSALTEELSALYGVPGKPGRWAIQGYGVQPPDGAVTVESDGAIFLQGSVYPQNGPMLERVIVTADGIWVEGMTR